MVYARIGSNSDVYVYSNSFKPPETSIVCAACKFKLGVALNRIGMLKHLQLHIDNGDRVPTYALLRLIDELNNDVIYNFRFNSNIVKSKVLRNLCRDIKMKYIKLGPWGRIIYDG